MSIIYLANFIIWLPSNALNIATAKFIHNCIKVKVCNVCFLCTV